MAKKIQTEDGFEFVVNPDSLVSRSRYFKAIFKYSRDPSILIRGISGSKMKLLLDYMERGNMVLKEMNIVHLLEAADYLMLDEMVKDVRSDLPSEITPSNCVGYFNSALNLNHLDTENLFYRYIQTHFESAVRLGDIGSLSHDHLKRFLMDSDLSLESEETVWKAVVKWVDNDAELRISFVPSLLACVRLELCTQDCIRKVMGHAFVVNNEVLGKIAAQTAITDCSGRTLEQHFVDNVKSLSHEALPLGPRQHTVCAVTCTEREWRGDIEIDVSLESDRSSRVAKIAERRDFHPEFMFCCDHRIYMFDNNVPEYIYFDLRTSSWTTMPSKLNDVAIEYAWFLDVKTRVYAIYSNYDSKTLHVAFFVPELSQWKECKSVPDPGVDNLVSFAATVHDGLIYTASASDMDFPQYTFGRVYDPSTDSWSEFPLPEIQSDNIAMVSHQGNLLMMRGESTSVDRYYPKEGIWGTFQELPVAYWTPYAEVRNDLLFVHGTLCTMNNDDEPMQESAEEEEEKKHAIFWDQDGGQWRDGSKLFGPVTNFPIDDAQVVGKYHRQSMEQEWQKLLKGWG